MHIVTGTVEHGDKRGRELGFPTANIAVTGLSPEQEVELSGVWAGVAEDRSTGESLTVTVSMGRRPTFYGPEGVFLLEAFCSTSRRGTRRTSTAGVGGASV